MGERHSWQTTESVKRHRNMTWPDMFRDSKSRNFEEPRVCVGRWQEITLMKLTRAKQLKATRF